VEAVRIPSGRTHDQRIIGKTIQCDLPLTVWLHHLLNPQIKHMMQEHIHEDG